MDEKSDNARYRLSVAGNVGGGVWKRIETAFEKNIKAEKYVIKRNEHAVIVYGDLLERAKLVILSVDESLSIAVSEVKQKYRYLFYAENLDCANCAAKIERICKRTIDHERIVVDFTTGKIIVETTRKYDPDELKKKIQENAETVDRHIEIKEKPNAKENGDKSDRAEKIGKREFIIGFSVFFPVFIIKSILIYGLHYDLRDKWWFYIIIYCFYIPAYIILAKDVLYNAFANLRGKRFFDENFLMSLATIMAFPCGLYDEAMFVIIFYRIGELLQQRAVNYSRRSIDELINIKPEKAVIEIDGEKQTVNPEIVVVGDIMCVNTGDRVAIDGVVVGGEADIDTGALTGESKGTIVGIGDEILSGSIVLSGSLKIKVTKTYENSMVAKILDMVDNAGALKSKSEKFISRFAKYYTPVIVGMAVILIFVLPASYGWNWKGFRDSFRVAMIFMVVSCPCALVISIPLSFFGGIGAASKQGILVKGSNYLELLDKTGIVVFDKTGTLTKGNFAVTKAVSLSKYTNEEILRFAAFAESVSNHVIAASLIKAYGKEIDSSVVEMIDREDKRGISAFVEGKEIDIGRKAFMDACKIKAAETIIEKDALLIAIDRKIAGYVIIEDEIREESKEVIAELKKLGVFKTIMITGDSSKIAEDVAKYLGIDEYYSDMNPLEKVERLASIKKQYPDKTVVFVGDGINDAPVISGADIGIAIGGLGNEATTQIADIVLVNPDLNKTVKAIEISRKTREIVIENVVFALLMKLIVLVLAPFNIAGNIALVYFAIFSDVGVSLIAVLNSLRTTKAGAKR